MHNTNESYLMRDMNLEISAGMGYSGGLRKRVLGYRVQGCRKRFGVRVCVSGSVLGISGTSIGEYTLGYMRLVIGNA
jgi:hypothetical protein